MSPPLALYVHFPWCVRKCPYCDFNSHTLHGELPQERYVQALERDIESQAEALVGRPLVSIFLGGGTPSLFGPEAIARVLAAAVKHLAVIGKIEVTMEANPGAIERGRFAEYADAGITRVSLGAQSFDARALQALGRIHSPAETARAAEELHAAGLANFNLDLMYALPGQTIADAVSDVDRALGLQPAHLSHYQLTIEAGTVFAASPPSLPADDAAALMLLQCRDQLASAGFSQYEVSAYSRSGHACLHNLNYWTFGDYVGIGAGAHGKLTLANAHLPYDSAPRTAPVSGVGPAVARAQARLPRPTYRSNSCSMRCVWSTDSMPRCSRSVPVSPGVTLTLRWSASSGVVCSRELRITTGPRSSGCDSSTIL